MFCALVAICLSCQSCVCRVCAVCVCARCMCVCWGLWCGQLNEIWPTGGWGSIEYGNPSIAGQVLGGRWKPLHYLVRWSVDVPACWDAGWRSPGK